MRTTTGSVLLLAMLALAGCGGGGGGSGDGSGGTSGWLIPQSQVVDAGPGQDGIPSIDRPVFAPVQDITFLGDAELVVGVKVGGESFAFPHQILNWHEVVNHTVGTDDYVLSYCPLTGSALAWDVDDGRLDPDFGVSGLLYNSNLILYDRDTGSFWSQMLEQSVRGSRSGEIPGRIQVIETTWATWRAMYPDSQVLTRETGHQRDYFAYPYGSYRWDDNLLFPVTREDNRLHPKRRVIGIRSATASKVYQVDSFGSDTQAINEHFDGNPVVVVGNSDLDFAAIYSRELADGTILDFTAVQAQLPVVMSDSEGNSWDVFGTAVSGPRAGTQLALTESYTAMWFAWAAFFGNAAIHFN